MNDQVTHTRPLFRQPLAVARIGCGGHKSLFKSTAAASALGISALVAGAGPISAQTVVPPTNGPCVVSGATALCTGNVSTGVVANAPLDTLNVNTLDRNITPALNNHGINFDVIGNQNITINSTTDPFSIVTTGAGRGINALLTGNGNVSVTSVGNVTSQEDGVYAGVTQDGNVFISSNGDIISTVEEGLDAEVGNNGNITIQSTGTITTDDESIDATVRNNGNITITSNGTLTSTSSSGIDIRVINDGTVVIDQVGNIIADEEAFDVDIGGVGPITINSRGNLTSQTESGIYAHNHGGNISITSVGNITSMDQGIDGYLYGNGDITIMSTGNVVSTNDRGLEGYIYRNGNVSITSVGNINSRDEGIETYVGGNGNITIMSTGDIVSTTDAGIDADIDGTGNITVNSKGDITANGNSNSGIEAYTDTGNISITSTGNITSNDYDAINAYVDGNGNINIRSNGTLRANTDGIYGRVDGNGNVTVNQTGPIVSDGRGINVFAPNIGTINVMSTGPITAINRGINAVGGNGVTINHTGNITSTNNIGIFTNNGTGTTSITVTNGVISANNAGISANSTNGPIVVNLVGGAVSGTTGIVMNSGNANSSTATVSGTVTGTAGTAIDFLNDGNDVLNINFGAIINGTIDMGNGNDGMGGTNPADIDTLNVAAGINTTLIFADSGAAGQGDTDIQSAPEIINLAGAGVLVNGTTLVVVDPTGFIAQGQFISDLTDSIFNSIDSLGDRFASHSGPSTEQGFAAAGQDGVDSGPRVWASAFGGTSELDTSGKSIGFDHTFGGLASGIEVGDAAYDGAWGVLGGGANAKLDLNLNAGTTDIDSVFGGITYKQDFGSHRIHAAFLVGASDHEGRRTVTGPRGGTALANYDGVFYAPALTVSAPLDWFASPVFVSGRASYVRFNLDDYTETGITDPLTIADRTISLVNLRGQLSIPQVIEHADASHTHVNWSLGVDTTQDVGSDDVNATVLATPFTFAADTQDFVSGFSGLNLTHTSADGAFSLTLSGEAQSDFNGGYQASGEIRATFRF